MTSIHLAAVQHIDYEVAITTSSAGELASVVHGHWEKFLQLSFPITVHQTMNQGPHYMTASGGIHDLVTHRDEGI